MDAMRSEQSFCVSLPKSFLQFLTTLMAPAIPDRSQRSLVLFCLPKESESRFLIRCFSNTFSVVTMLILTAKSSPKRLKRLKRSL